MDEIHPDGRLKLRKFEAILGEKILFLDNLYSVVHWYYLDDVDWLYRRSYRIEMDSVNGFHIQDFQESQEKYKIENEHGTVAVILL